MSRDFFEAGYCIEPDVLDAGTCNELTTCVEALPSGAGSRRLLDVPAVAQVARRLRRHARISPLLPPEAVAVQCVYFNKSASTNWGVGLHQDTIFPLRERVTSGSFCNWSSKEGITYAQLPVQILQEMVAVRVHLDDSFAESGPLRVVPGSHRRGLLSEAAISVGAEAVQCCIARAGVLVLRPLLLHASAKLAGACPRRVLHFVYASSALPNLARWHYEV